LRHGCYIGGHEVDQTI